MKLCFKQWLQNEEQTAGPVDSSDTDNTAADDAFARKVRSKYRTGGKPQSEFSPEKLFGRAITKKKQKK